jgi:hypothetical protein
MKSGRPTQSGSTSKGIGMQTRAQDEQDGTRRAAIAIAMMAGPDHFRVMILDELITSDWSGNDIESLSNEIRKMAWARQRGEV